MQISKYANMKNQDGDGPVLERITAGQFGGDIEWTSLRAIALYLVSTSFNLRKYLGCRVLCLSVCTYVGSLPDQVDRGALFFEDGRVIRWEFRILK